MNPQQTSFVAGTLSFILLLAAPLQAADPKPLNITDLAGAIRIQQGLPCGNTLDVTTPVDSGRMEMTWVDTREGVLFDLTRLHMFVTPFRVAANCNGLGGSVEFREIGVQLASAVRFTGVPIGGERDSSLFRFTIPKEQFLIYGSVLHSALAGRPETAYQRPSQDVAGLIDLGRQTVQLHVVLAGELRFRAGCMGNRCTIDETLRGTTTADIRGGEFAATPPAAACTQGARCR